MPSRSSTRLALLVILVSVLVQVRDANRHKKNRFWPNNAGLPVVITPFDFQKAIQSATQWMQSLQSTENDLQTRNLFAKSNSVEGEHQDFLGNNPTSQQMGRMGQMIMQTIINLAKAFGISLESSPQAFQSLQPVASFANSVTGSCPQPVRCFRSVYRTADGSCNNRVHGDWGKSFSPYNRLANPEYLDGFDAPKTVGKSGNGLPSARVVSFTVAPDADSNSRRLSLLVMQWGQFLDHDLTGAATTRSQNGQSIRCCGQEFDQNPNLRHPACFVIEIPPNDPFYSREGKRCMSFVRSAAAVRPGCEFGPREQLNQLSAYIDGGMIYGKTLDEQNDLRAFIEGKLKTSIVDGGHFLPQQTSGCQIPDQIKQQKGDMNCFKSGDSRVNVQANLVVMHTLFLRHHNFVATQLGRMNPTWDDEKLFQEARRIVIAQLQVITYNEFLPVILGDATMNQFGLKLTEGGQYSNDYDESTNAQILSEFATAAYRMHTLIPKSIDFMNNNGQSITKMDISETFNNPSVVYEAGAYTSLLNGLTSQAAGDYDQFFTKQISNHMFRPFGKSSGIDLVAVNIQRGRDHGLPGYNNMRTACGLNPVSSWQELESILRPGAAQALRTVYSSVDDIDLFIGGVSEVSNQGSLVGPTFACILGEQFKRTKKGDRFWFENGPNISPKPFTQGQLAELKKTSLAKIICEAGKGIQQVQPFAMLKANNEWNRKTNCETLPAVDWTIFGQ